MADDAFCLGIDIGTTSVKVSLFDLKTNSSVFTTSEKTRADIKGEENEAVQDVSAIFHSLTECVNRITEHKRSHVVCVAVSAQMHGIVLWNSDDPQNSYSNLYTWQDQRASRKFIAQLPRPDSNIHPAAGYGCVTLFWLCRNDPEMLLKYNAVGTIADYFITGLCGLDKPMMGHQMAASWGYYNTDSQSWNSDILKEAGFPVNLLPVVVESGTKVGVVNHDWLGIPAGATVLSSLGDLQCAFVSAAQSKTDAVLNMSTSCQLSYQVLCSSFIPPRTDGPMAITHVPLFDGSYLAVVASLNGGNVIQKFVEMLRSWFADFGFHVTDDKIYDHLNQLANENNGSETNTSQDLSILPRIFGERHNPDLLGSVSGINATNTSLPAVFRSVCKGLVQNISQMLPCSKLMESGINRLCVSGSVLEKIPHVRKSVYEIYSPLEIREGSGVDSAEGACLVAAKYMKSLS